MFLRDIEIFVDGWETGLYRKNKLIILKELYSLSMPLNHAQATVATIKCRYCRDEQYLKRIAATFYTLYRKVTPEFGYDMYFALVTEMKEIS